MLSIAAILVLARYGALLLEGRPLLPGLLQLLWEALFCRLANLHLRLAVFVYHFVVVELQSRLLIFKWICGYA